MLERVQDGPAQTVALRASGTVVAQGCREPRSTRPGRSRDRPRRDHRPGFWRRFRRIGARACNLRAGSQVAGQARCRRRPGTDGRGHAQQLRGFARPHSPVRSRGRERRARMGGGGSARGVAAACTAQIQRHRSAGARSDDSMDRASAAAPRARSGRLCLVCLGSVVRFVAKTPAYRGIGFLLDFLGFSRPKSRLFNGLHGAFRGKVFFAVR